MKKDQRGSLHLAGILAIIVIAVVAFVGVKVLNQSHAEELGSDKIAITSPVAKATISGFTPVVAQLRQLKGTVIKVDFYANNKPIQDAGLSKCYPTGPIPDPGPRTYVTCFDTTAITGTAQYELTAKLTFKNGSTARSFPVAVTISNPVLPPLSVKITSPVNNASVSGYVPVVVYRSSSAKNLTITVNNRPIVDAGLANCYSNAMPIPPVGTTVTCLNTQDTALVYAPQIVIKATVSDDSLNTVSDTVTVNHPIPVPPVTSVPLPITNDQ